MLVFSVRNEVEQKLRSFDQRVRSQVPFATAKALTRTAYAVRDAERAEVAAVFDRPTPWTLNSMVVKAATKVSQQAAVTFKDPRAKGTPYERALAHQITGGTREWKRFELALRRIGALPDGMAAVPGQTATMDSYGNMSRGQIVQILAYLQAFGEQGYRANMSGKGRARLERRGRSAAGFATIGGVAYFVSRGPGNWFGRGAWKEGRAQHLPPGVWAKSGTHGARVRPVLMFVRRPSYSPRWRFDEIAARVAAERFTIEFNAALSSAVASAR